MEMESSRRPPFDRSNLISKKPRLTEDSTLGGRQFQQPPLQRSAIGLGSGSTRFRANERDRESDDSVRGSLQQFQQHQELVNQYKTALAELTFNSKPIITNLTIIAGENLQAAKAIAATICANIIEVPAEQKLPSLYLLDSIVKNIGRDYIKYFATKLPEVFCKAYRHVDPSVHSGMRHLFGTWKGVFPPQALQIIEKELGFLTAVNGASSGTTTSKSERQPQSIHVNPKYLEARHRFQQSSKMKGTDIGLSDVGSSEDAERPERTTGAGTERPWMDPTIKMHNMRPQREPLRESGLPKQGGAVYGDYENASGISRPLSTSGGKPSEKLNGQRWLGAGREGEESISGEKNGFDIKRIPKYTAVRPASSSIPSVQKQPRFAAEISESWKNSEEEEFMWDDMGTKAMDPGATPVLKKEIWSEDLEKVEMSRHLPKWKSQTEVRSNFEREHSADSLSSEQKDQLPLGHPRSSHWKMQELHQADSSSPLLQQMGPHSVIGPSSVAVSSFGVPTTAVSASAGSIGRLSLGHSVISQRPPSPLLSKRDPRQSLVEKDHMRSYSLVRTDPRAASLSGQLNARVRDKTSQDSVPSRLQNLSVQKLEAQALQKTPSPTPFQQRPVPPAEKLSNSKTELSDIVQKAQQLLGSSMMKKGASPDTLNPIAGDMQGQSNVSSLLAAVMKSGLLSGSSASEHIGLRPPPTTPLASQSTLVSSKDATASSGPRDSTGTIPRSKVEKTPLVSPISPSAIMSSTLAQTSNVAAAKSNPLSILSTLISKGLISAPQTEAAAAVSVKSEAQLQAQSPITATVTAGTAPPVSKVSAAIPESSTENISAFELDEKKPDTVQSMKEVKDPIGYEFRPRVLRDLHPAVIDRLSENLPHRCIACGLRFKLQERLARHSEWHAFKNSIPNCLNKPSRRWYSKPADWVAGKAGFPFGYHSTCLIEGFSRMREENEKMVPADESQCVCLLCGELFEDFYSQERDEWMFKGAVYLSTTSGSTEEGGSCSESDSQKLIVHANCMSGDTTRDLGSIRGIKVEKGT
ncbi:polyadenylation and cleavage factor homolog 4 isoform X2 [Spinacia oleracea]|uniref:Polyadenylation and cleavage factor homolog 4 isoform X2 n=1 Tax=Spinacia oleracea TaxID=3562 RepID=A0A9R0HQV3_SPIOL|nr:polyadenylation and cleavage factor homolog 4 isoform X2 [Spinacia oleracea]